MNRRDFLRSAAIATTGLALPRPRRLLADAPAVAPGWRTFQVTTRVEVLKPSGPTRVWLPTALIEPTPFQKTLANEFHAENGEAELVDPRPEALGIVSARYPAGARPVLTLTSRVQTRDVLVDLASATKTAPAPAAELEYCLRATPLMPTDGIVKATALEITRDARTDAEKAKAIYEWIVVNTFRNPKTRGCGNGDVKFMLESKDFGGKCADLNALYVALARSVGIPARDVYGIRIAPSNLGYKSLGASSEIVTKAQHCRAEVYLQEHGWVPVDPADVRKVVLEEPPGNRPIDDEMVAKARGRLFGSWEMNWMAYNFAHDVALPGSSGGRLAFFMYPQAETAEGRIDCLDAATFQYEITAKELPAAA
jgi:transglutaminase-like putative cysteine protease